MGTDGRILRPYLPGRSAEAQDLTPFFCGECGIQLGPKDEYLTRFFDRATGFRLFEGALQGPPLPASFLVCTVRLRCLDLMNRSSNRWSGVRYRRAIAST